jgi:small conductance mechanosensitive channel
MDLLAQFTQSVSNLTDKLSTWIDKIITSLPNLILGLLIFSLGLFFSRYVQKATARILKKFISSTAVVNLLSNVASVGFVIIALIITLSVLNLGTAVTSLLAGAGVAGLAIGLAVQDPIVNLLSGIMMSMRNHYRIGDWVETNSFFGQIRQISLRNTVIVTPLGLEVILPNRMVIQNPLTNYTNTQERRVEIACGISYGDDLEEVEKITRQAIEEGVDYDKNRPIDFFYTDYGDSSINFIIRYWMDRASQPDFLKARHEGIMAMKKAFDENDITIPFPIRTLDFGIKGGERLDQMKPFKTVEISNSN